MVGGANAKCLLQCTRIGEYTSEMYQERVSMLTKEVLMRMDLEQAKDEKFLNILKGTPGLEHLVDTIEGMT